MVRKYVYGEPFETEAVVQLMEAEQGQEELGIGQVSLKDGFLFSYEMAENDIVYGLGEANRGLNKRGYCYIVRTSRTTRRISVPCMARIILSWFPGRRILDCSSIIRLSLHLTSAIQGRISWR